MSDKTQEQRSSPETIETEMPETTGTQTRQVKITDHGLAKPDDPVYKEDWTVTLPQSGRRSPTPSGSTPVRRFVPMTELEHQELREKLAQMDKDKK